MFIYFDKSYTVKEYNFIICWQVQPVPIQPAPASSNQTLHSGLVHGSTRISQIGMNTSTGTTTTGNKTVHLLFIRCFCIGQWRSRTPIDRLMPK